MKLSSVKIGKNGGMESHAKVMGHPLHPILIVVPLGLFVTASIFDIMHAFKGRAQAENEAAEEGDASSDGLATASYYMIGAGVLGGLAAAIPGWIDWFALPHGTRAKRIGLVHGVGNMIVTALYGGSWLGRRGNVGRAGSGALAMSFGGFALGGLTAWLGGELVHRMGVSIDEGADLDASDSFADHLKGHSDAARRP